MRLWTGSAIGSLGYTPVNKAGDTMTGNLIVQGFVYSDPAAGDARIGGEAASITDKVRFEAVIPGSGTWYFGADGADSSRFKFDWNDPTFATPNIIIDPTSHAITFSTYGVSGTRQSLSLNGVNSTPAANDDIYQSAMLSNTALAQVEATRITHRLTTVTAGAEAAQMIFMIRAAGTLANKFVIGTSFIAPTSNDGLALGTSALGFADLFFASGGVINFNAGAFTFTQAAGVVTASGVLVVTGGVTIGTAAAMLTSNVTMTAGSTANVPTLTTGPVTGNPTKWIPFNDNGTTRHFPAW